VVTALWRSRGDITENNFNMASVRELEFDMFRSLLDVHPRNEYLYEGTKFDRSRVIQAEIWI